MALISANELKRKLLIGVEGQPYVVLEVFFASPTARGAATMVRTKLRHLLTGAVMEKSFRSSEKFEEPDVELVPASFLYSDAHGFHFMDEKSYEQFTFSADDVEPDRGRRRVPDSGRVDVGGHHLQDRTGRDPLEPSQPGPQRGHGVSRQIGVALTRFQLRTDHSMAD